MGNIFIVDMGNNCIREVNSSSGIITTVAGYHDSAQAFSGDGGAATDASLNLPRNVAIDSVGNIYIADTNNFRIRKVTLATGIITTVAGNGTESVNSPDGLPATSIPLNSPYSVAVDGSGNIYIDEEGNSRIREVLAATGIISTVVGNGHPGYSGDGGHATNAEINMSFSNIAVDSSGNLYLDDNGNHVIRKVLAASGTISTVAGNGNAGFSGDGGAATNAEIDSSFGAVAVDAAHNFYIADNGNNRVRAVGESYLTPQLTWDVPASIIYGTTLSAAQLDATANGVPGNFSYSPGLGTVLSAGQQTLSVTFTPTDNEDYDIAPVSTSVQITVMKATPTIAWPTPSPIANGTPLGSSQLDAASNVSGSFVYSPETGSVLEPGPHTLQVVMTPTDVIDYNVVAASTNLTVQPGAQFDTGTINLLLGSGTPDTVVASTTYGASDTPSSIAQKLANNATGASFVRIVAVEDMLYLHANQAGAGTNYNFALQVADSVPSDFPSPSFAGEPASGQLVGGVNAAPPGQVPTTDYSYSVAPSGYDSAGNPLSYTDSVTGIWSFSYDTLGRLVTSSRSSPQSANYCWSYDSFGNRTAQESSPSPFQAQFGSAESCTLQSGAALTSSVIVSYNANNQMISTPYNPNQSDGYDRAGNMAYDGVNSYLYDAEGRICAVYSSPIAGTSSMIGYIYDAEGRRIAKGTIASWSCDLTKNQFSTSNDYVLGPSGEQLTEKALTVANGSSTMAWLHTNVWADGQLIATYDNAGLHFYFGDPLGTRRVQTDYAGVIEQTCSSLPYGDGESCGIAPTEHLFTGKERDTESGNDYFGARYYASSMGRMLSPDPGTPTPLHLLNPLRWNMYSYALNNPFSYTDSTEMPAPNGFWWQLSEFQSWPVKATLEAVMPFKRELCTWVVS